MNSSALPDVRWQQRLTNLEAAFAQLRSAVELYRQRHLSDLERQGLVKAFEFTHELSWNVMKDYLEYQGTQNITGSRDAARESFQRGLIQSGDVWMEMIRSRNLTSHTYHRKVAEELTEKIASAYYQRFLEFIQHMRQLASQAT
jgi:nucleotidyltransferase substrate binding protein (TIGR01987 family)